MLVLEIFLFHLIKSISINRQPRSKSGSKTKSRSHSPRKSRRDDDEKVKKAESKPRISRKSRYNLIFKYFHNL